MLYSFSLPEPYFSIGSRSTDMRTDVSTCMDTCITYVYDFKTGDEHAFRGSIKCEYQPPITRYSESISHLGRRRVRMLTAPMQHWGKVRSRKTSMSLKSQRLHLNEPHGLSARVNSTVTALRNTSETCNSTPITIRESEGWCPPTVVGSHHYH